MLGGGFKEASSDKDDSYNNEFTNVAKGYDAIDPNADNQVSWYIEGIGTEDKESDSILKGVAQGTGSTGVVAKVAKGCLKGAQAIVDKLKNNIRPINILTVNVFGFSRGAAAARHFVHVANSKAYVSYSNFGKVLQVFPPEDIKDGYLTISDKDGSKDAFINQHGYFGACLLAQGLEVKEIRFRFAGLYDTVASYGLNHRGGFGIDNDTKQLGLDTIGRGKVQFALQLASDDEYRDNFDLTNINSTGLYGLEFTLPGVHSDIGGSYGIGEEISVLYCDPYDPYQNVETHKECEAFKKIVVEEGWYHEDQLKIKYFYQKDVNYDRWWNKGAQYYGLVGTRKLSNMYDKIPLNQMFHYSRNNNIKYLEDVIEKNHKINDSFMKKIYSQLSTYMNACNDLRNKYIEAYNSGDTSSSSRYIKDIKAISYLGHIDKEDLKILRNQYLHWSAKTNQIGLDTRPNDNAPKERGALEAKYRKRNIQDG
ncbi:T6SS phospholipase effector Tle1-like catalytic domain-containing protein [Chryseobacterium proteolyticum]